MIHPLVLATVALLAAVAAPGPGRGEPANPAAVLPPEAFAELPFLEAPRLSPDGEHVAVKVSIIVPRPATASPSSDSARASGA